MDRDAKSRGKRSESRLRTRLPARLITLGGEYQVVLCDLSRNGARLSRSGLPSDSGDAVLLWDRYEAFGAIRWTLGDEFGLTFHEPIPADWVIATRNLDAAGQLPDERELKRRVARDWVHGRPAFSGRFRA